MRIATILFTYHRSHHTEQVLKSLKNNTVLPEKLFVFQDGLKSEEDDYEWKKVNNLIKDIDWCETSIVVSDHNRGLAESVVSGVNYVLKEYDAVIVIEDDCVLSPSYMKFMVQGLKKYEQNPKVYSVSGYCWPLALEKNQYDAFGCGRVSTLGWGTWGDRWKKYKKDTDVIKRLKSDQVKSKNLAVWGRDLEAMLLGTISGQFDSWGVFWTLNVIENEGICINPYNSLVRHIGWDDTGTNTHRSDMLEDTISNDIVEDFIFPDEVMVLENTKNVFAKFYGSDTAVSHKDKCKENVLVYGLGNFYLQSEQAVNESYNIQAFIDRRKHGWFAGKKVITIDKIAQYQYDKILVMILDIQECINISKDLIRYGVSPEQIVLGNGLYGDHMKYIDKITILSEKNEIKLAVLINGIYVKVRSKDEFCNMYDALVNQIWNYSINNGKQDVVLDVGMNIGDTALYFLKMKKVKKVFGYEPFRKTYQDAVDNLQNYLYSSERVEVFQYGISNENNSRVIEFNKDMTCGQSSLADIRKENYEWYRNAGLVQSENEEKEHIRIRDAAEVFRPIIEKYVDCNMILKMNCEGEEYNIMERLAAEDLLGRFSMILLEWHYRGKECILNHLSKAGFTYWFIDKERNMGFIYACKN